MSVGVQQLLGGEADALLLVIGSSAIVPLVMFRIRGLVAQRAAAEEALAHQAMHDSLTGLANRAHFVGMLEKALHRVREGSSSSVAVVFCDLDGFKAINDNLGHPAGDRVLATVAQRLRKCVRDVDIVSRFGGDEFLILCENLTEAEVAARVAHRISIELDRPITLGSTSARIAASVGVAATTTQGNQSAEEIIREADFAMYQAKHSSAQRPRLVAVPTSGR